MDFLNTNTVVAQRFQLNYIISSGNIARTYEFYDKIDCNLVAVKVLKYNVQQHKVSQRESHILRILKEVAGIPRFIWFGKDQNFSYLVMQLLGCSLSDMLKEKKQLPLILICDIAIQLIKILSSVHSKQILHRDIKPKNIMFGQNDKKDVLYLVEFGISYSLEDQIQNPMQSDKKEIQTGKPFVGSTSFASIASHLGQEQGKKDDLESLGYVFIYLFKGKLPWQKKYKSNIYKQGQIGEEKQKIQLSNLCKNLPQQLLRYFEHCRMLQFDEDPDYFYLQQLFIVMKQKTAQQSQSQSKFKSPTDKYPQIQIKQDFNHEKQLDLQSSNNLSPKRRINLEEQFSPNKKQTLMSSQENKSHNQVKMISQAEIEKINSQKLKLFKTYLNGKASKSSQGQEFQCSEGQESQPMSSQIIFNLIHLPLSENYQDDEIRRLQNISNDDINENNDLNEKIKNLSSPVRNFKEKLL